ncbi:dTMP kinase [Gimibacter soli]|uniref:Thymidylate kinase n=1 Tax=Gimibacter soli TaxID=3024400 RepID=A0AAE9XMA8_9PROT|nr:dTMP kinase [Gimibacter soli]WCL52871.1 dTMP kinase [Gimibacter soli]
MTRGRFITLEGGEGAGKSTQIRRLAARLQASGLKVLLTREPGGSPGAEEIRSLLVTGEPGRWTPMTEALLVTAARADHVARTVIPALERGDWVISDRFYDSTIAYQGYAHGLGAEKMEDLQRLALGDLAPDLTLILDLPVDVGLARAGYREGQVKGGEDRFERMPKSFHEALADGFRQIAETHKDRCALIDAAGDADAVEAAIWAVAQARLGLG